MRVITLEEIEVALREVDVVSVIEEGLVAYSNGQAVVPLPGEMAFQNPPGDVHIKYGYLEDGDCYVVKVASGFYENPKRFSLPSSNGLMLLFDKGTGEPLCIFLDEGRLTDLRTAAAGAVAAKYLAPSGARRIGILGTGIQAKLQLRYLEGVVGCREVLVWGRSEEGLARYQAETGREGFRVETTLEARDVGASCDLIVTATASTSPLLDQVTVADLTGLAVQDLQIATAVYHALAGSRD